MCAVFLKRAKPNMYPEKYASPRSSIPQLWVRETSEKIQTVLYPMQNRPIHVFLGSRTSENEAMSMKIICFVTFAEILGDPFDKILAFPLDFLSKCTGEQVAGP